MLGQAETAKYLDQCNGSRVAIEEVLSAYIVCKYLKGSTSERVLLKLRYLAIYLRVTRRSHILNAGADEFKALTMEVALGGGRIGLLPTVSVPGRAAWNELRRTAATSLVTDSVYGGPGPVQTFLSLSQSQPYRGNESRTPWLDRYFAGRLRIGDMVLPGVVPPDYASDLERLTTLPAYASRDDTASAPVMVA
ncbi:hypothetical protein DFH07DRAFT_844696 [Mycena maculata]|uniref:Uncharacterized protein n=1 Tax=Mycena maculata TaxID=230809 RepID=A0AAD7MW13_9AGAR|nr:hypothetical protein DFH07DRAFT_844696 [Mycena maculata]